MDPGEGIAAAVAVAGPLAAAGLGLIFGSFANVCIHRIPEGVSVVTPRSRCPACGGEIAWYDNVPVVSWLALRARCRACRAPIAPVYPIVEAVMALGFLAAFLKFGPGLDAAAAAVLVFVCVVLTVIDLRLFILPDALTLPGIAAGLGFALARGLVARAAGEASWWGGLLDARVLPLAALGGAAVGAAVPLVARLGYMALRRLRGGEEPSAVSIEIPAGAGEAEPADPLAPPPGAGAGAAAADVADDVAEAAAAEGMGMGDVKMLAMIGAFLGPRLTLMTILLGSIGGCLTVIPWLLLSRRSFRTPVPFGPFLAAGAVLTLFVGEGLAAWYSTFIVRLFR